MARFDQPFGLTDHKTGFVAEYVRNAHGASVAGRIEMSERRIRRAERAMTELRTVRRILLDDNEEIIPGPDGSFHLTTDDFLSWETGETPHRARLVLDVAAVCAECGGNVERCHDRGAAVVIGASDAITGETETSVVHVVTQPGPAGVGTGITVEVEPVPFLDMSYTPTHIGLIRAPLGRAFDIPMRENNSPGAPAFDCGE